MIKYKIKEESYYDYQKKKRRFLVIELEQKYGALMGFLLSDVKVNFDYYRSTIEEFFREEKEVAVMQGDTYLLKMSKDRSIIEDILRDEDERGGMEKEDLVCEVDTRDLYEIILIWEKAMKDHIKGETIL